MPNRTVAMRKGEARLHKFAVDLVEEAELDRIGGVAPDRKVAAAIGQSGPKSAGVGGMHGA